LKKIIVSGQLLFIFALFPLSAANVSFLVMETGLRQESPTGQYSILWENGLMDTFYECGHIVSNAPLMRVYEKCEDGFPSDAERDYKEAKNGGMDFFIIAIINYSAYRGNNPQPHNIILRLFNTKSEQMIHEQIFSHKISKTAKEEKDNIKNAAMEFAVHIRR